MEPVFGCPTGIAMHRLALAIAIHSQSKGRMRILQPMGFLTLPELL